MRNTLSGAARKERNREEREGPWHGVYTLPNRWLAPLYSHFGSILCEPCFRYAVWDVVRPAAQPSRSKRPKQMASMTT